MNNLTTSSKFVNQQRVPMVQDNLSHGSRASHFFSSHLTSPANLCYRFIIAGKKLRAAVKANSAKPFNFATAYNLTKEQVSPEHQRPSAQLVCTKYRTSNKYHLQYYLLILQVHACLHVCSHIHSCITHTYTTHTHTYATHTQASHIHTHTPHTHTIHTSHYTHIHHTHAHATHISS